MGEMGNGIVARKANGRVWFYRIASLACLAMGAIGVMYGTSISDPGLQYVGVVSLILAVYCEVRIGNGEA